VRRSLSVESGFSRNRRRRGGGADGHFDAGLPETITTGRGYAEIAQVFEQRETVLAGIDHVDISMSKGCDYDEVERAGGVVAHGGGVSGEAEGAARDARVLASSSTIRMWAKPEGSALGLLQRASTTARCSGRATNST